MIKMNSFILKYYCFLPFIIFISNIFQNVFKLGDFLNPLLVISFIINMIYIFKKNLKKSYILSLFISFSIVIWQLTTNSHFNSINMTIRFLNCILILYILSDVEFRKQFIDTLNCYQKVNLIGITLIILLFLIQIFTQSGYEIIWGNRKYFISVFRSPHDLGYFLIILSCMLSYYKFKYDNNKLMIYMIILLFISLLTGARVTLLAQLIILLLEFKKNIVNTGIWLYIGIIVVFLVFIMVDINILIEKIPFLDKTLLTVTQGSITSGRDTILNNCLRGYMALDNGRKLLGSGSEYTYLLNYNGIGTKIWAHNDFMQILISYGLIGLISYLYIFIKSLSSSKSLLVFISIFVLAYNNGLFVYYTFVMALPYIYILNDLKK